MTLSKTLNNITLAQKLFYNPCSIIHFNTMTMSLKMQTTLFPRLSLLVLFLLTQFITMAQDTTYSTSTTTASEELWYMQPWAWIAGGVVLLLLLIALFSGGKKKDNSTRTDKVIITKTVRTETDVD
jgi:hypothetical protein